MLETVIEQIRNDPPTPYKKGLLAALSQAALGFEAHKKCLDDSDETGSQVYKGVNTNPTNYLGVQMDAGG